MNSKKNESTKGMFDNKVIHYALQLLALSLLIYFCFEIIKPFIHLLIWGSVIAITLFPLHNRLTRMLKGRRWISASIITTIMFLFIIGPATLLTLATVDEFK
jgi:predicted PurR-regulated permease PerM